MITTSELLTPSEVARIFNVHAKTVTRWAKQGRLKSIQTIGGHRRYHAAEVRAFLNAGTTVRKPPEPPSDKAAWIRRNHALIRQLACPQCDAATGESCRGPGGGRVYIPHQARRHAAAEAGVYRP